MYWLAWIKIKLMCRYGVCTRVAQQYKMAYSQPTSNNSNPIPLMVRGIDTAVTLTHTGTATTAAAYVWTSHFWVACMTRRLIVNPLYINKKNGHHARIHWGILLTSADRNLIFRVFMIETSRKPYFNPWSRYYKR